MQASCNVPTPRTPPDPRPSDEIDHPPLSTPTPCELKTKVNLLDNLQKRIVRFPDRHSVNAKEAVKSIVIGLGIKCVWYSMSEEDIRANITSTIRELEVKNYPKSWWRGHLFMAVERSGHLLGAQVACLLRDHTNPR